MSPTVSSAAAVPVAEQHRCSHIAVDQWSRRSATGSAVGTSFLELIRLHRNSIDGR
jgi:hypothetical protein